MIIKRKEQTLQALNSPGSRLRKTIKKSKFEEIDIGLKNFVSNASSQGLQVSTSVLQEKARELAIKSGAGSDFKASSGYISNFKKRNLLIPTEDENDESVDNSIILNWDQQLRNLIKDFEPKNVFNADEFALFWNVQPNSINQCEKNQSKERITGLVCASMLGEKFELICIGKNQRPKSWNQMKNLNMRYFFNG